MRHRESLRALYGFVLTEFEGRFLWSNEVHAVAAQLPDTPAQRLGMVKSY